MDYNFLFFSRVFFSVAHVFRVHLPCFFGSLRALHGGPFLGGLGFLLFQSFHSLVANMTGFLMLFRYFYFTFIT